MNLLWEREKEFLFKIDETKNRIQFPRNLINVLTNDEASNYQKQFFSITQNVFYRCSCTKPPSPHTNILNYTILPLCLKSCHEECTLQGEKNTISCTEWITIITMFVGIIWVTFFMFQPVPGPKFLRPLMTRKSLDFRTNILTNTPLHIHSTFIHIHTQ